ncbi:MAG TPA: hypothetical protein ENJ32_14395 [Crenotrichaceae bacterium]|nr:hypothetical protein [Crenotrichaceae bacterium]
MPVKSKSGRSFELPTDEEEIDINTGIAYDPDTYELSNEEFSKLRPVGRPMADVKKDRITIRLSTEVTDYFRATGKGWQTRVDKVLLEYVSTHK